MIKRVVYTSFWSNPQVIDQYSLEDKIFYLYLLTNEKTSQLGIYTLPKRIISFDLEISLAKVDELIERFEVTYEKIIYNAQTQEVALLDYLSFSILKGGKPVLDLLMKELNQVTDIGLIQAVNASMQTYWTASHRPFDHRVQELFSAYLTNYRRNEKEVLGDLLVESKEINTQQEHSIADIEIQEGEEKFLEHYISYLTNSLELDEGVVTEGNLLEHFYEATFGQITNHIQDVLDYWKMSFPLSVLIEAFARSQHAGHPLSYAESILKRWEEKNVRCLQDIKQLDAEFH